MRRTHYPAALLLVSVNDQYKQYKHYNRFRSSKPEAAKYHPEVLTEEQVVVDPD